MVAKRQIGLKLDLDLKYRLDSEVVEGARGEFMRMAIEEKLDRLVADKVGRGR